VASYDSEKIIRDLFVSLLRRLPEPDDVKYYSDIIDDGRLCDAIKEIVDSDEFNNKYLQTADPASLIHPIDAVDKPLDIFIHIPKAAGISLYSMMSGAFGSDYVSPPFIRLSSKPPSWVYRYSILFGHFDYDECALLTVQREKRIFTFLRDPERRLISTYFFWRVHDIDCHLDIEPVILANKFDIVSFFTDQKIIEDTHLFNEMTKHIMGLRLWREWKKRYPFLKSQAQIDRFIEDEVREKVKDRLREFTFIGLQEGFERSARLLFHILGKDCPDIAQENVTDKNMKRPGFKKIEKPEITPELQRVLRDLTSIDRVVYEEGRKIYFDLIKKYSTISEIAFVIDFKSGGNSDRFIVKGFSQAEDWGIWSCAKEGIISFYLSDSDVKPLYMKLYFNILVNDKHSQTFEFYLNDNLLGKKTYNNEYDELVFDISNFASYENTLTIKIPDAATPKSLGINEDTRELGIGLIRIEFKS
jgi:hypothetical protein